MEPTTELTPIQLKVINLVARSLSLIEAVDQAGTTWSELALWRSTVPAFQDALEQAMQERVIVNQERIQGLVFHAIEVLGKVLKDDKASPSVRLRAAQAVFKMTTAAKKPKSKAEPAAETEILHNSAQSPIRLAADPGRNSLCTCGSGLKFKRCCANPVPQTIPSAA
jgi:uncharacterized protein YecA (UPF0149 family)